MKAFFCGLLLAVALSASASENILPSRADVLKEMAVPSTEKVRGQKDGTGYARTPAQMDEIWKLSETPPSPLCFELEPPKEALVVIVPHDDYVYAGRIYRQIIPSLKAKTVVLIGPFHRWRDFNISGKVIFDSYDAWRTPDGDVPVSKMRETMIAGLPDSRFVRDNTMHDAEHSIEGPLYWLKHSKPDVEIIPVLVTPMDFQTMQEIVFNLSMALGNYLEFNGKNVGGDIAFLISADAVHYGPDFSYTPYGPGGIEAYKNAVDNDKQIISRLLSGTVNERRLRAIYDKFQDKNSPESAKITWCGRFSIPLGLTFASQLFNGLKGKENRAMVLYGNAVAYSTSIGSPQLPSKTGLSTTAPSNLYHFVGYPGVIYDKALVQPLEQNRELLE